MTTNRKATRIRERRAYRREAVLRYASATPDTVHHDPKGEVSGSFYVPIDPADVAPLQQVLRTITPFSSTFPNGDGLADLYNIATYRYQLAHHRTQPALLVDRNIMTRWLELASGQRAESAHRHAAAILAFAQCAEIIIEPNIALYEVAASNGDDAARSEIAPFRTIDNVRPQSLVDVALNRTDKIPSAALRAAESLARRSQERLPPPGTFNQLREYQFVYPAVLKIALLESSSLDPETKVATLFDWFHQHYWWVGAAGAFALRYFAPRLSKPDWLKGIRSSDRSKALRRVRNVTWDVVNVSNWIHRAKRSTDSASGPLWLLGSLDRAVHEVAQHVIFREGEEVLREQLLRSRLSDWYGSTAGEKLSRLHEELLARARDEQRAANTSSEATVPIMTAQLEGELVGTSAPSRGTTRASD